MILVNKKLYHYIDGRRYNPNWQEGTNFFVGKNYQNNVCKGITPINADEPLINKKIEYYTLLKNNGQHLTSNDKVVIREKMLELYRSMYCPKTISRMNCMYFCDEKSLIYWSHMFPSYYELYEVVLNGEAFKTSSTLLPIISNNYIYTFEEFIDLCNKYWNPNLMDENLCCFSEYLYQGEVYVNAKLDKEKVKNMYIIKK